MRTSKKISVIMPVYNDEGGIIENADKAHDAMEGFAYAYEIILVDDGSTDKTIHGVRVMDLVKDIHAISYKENKGKGHAFLTGFDRSVGEYILLVDSDMQIEISELPTFFKIMETYNADVVVGNKRHLYSNIRYSALRHIVSNTYNMMCRFMFGMQIRDTQCGFKLFKRSALASVRDKIKTKRFAFDLELLVALRENGYRIADAPVFMKRPYNAGSVSIKNIWETFRDTIAIWIRKKGGFYGK